MTGERDIRSEDRQLLLDAICAATDAMAALRCVVIRPIIFEP